MTFPRAMTECRPGMAPTPRDLRHETFRDLYFAERSRREQIRSSIGIPAAAVPFALYAYLTLAAKIEVQVVVRHVPSMIMAAMAILAVVFLALAMWRIVRVEWLFVYNEPPDLDELMRLERTLRERLPDRHPPEEVEQAVAEATLEALTAGYYIGYQRYFAGNTESARQRTWAVRMVLASVFTLFVAVCLLPMHTAVAARTAVGGG